MMNTMNPWKLATIGMSLVGVTALSTGVTTAYFMRPGTEPAAQTLAPAASTGLTVPGSAAFTAPATTPAVQTVPAAQAAPPVQYVTTAPAPRPVVRPAATRVVRTA